MNERAVLRDPWVGGGLALLALLTFGAAMLYRGAPQSFAEVRSDARVAVRPAAFEQRMARAEERKQAASDIASAGDTVEALRVYAAAGEEAWSARGLARDPAEAAAGTELWAEIVLDRSALMLAAASSPWWRRDDDPALRDALARVEDVLVHPTSPATRGRAETLAAEIRNKLRPGPLEWLPLR